LLIECGIPMKKLKAALDFNLKDLSCIYSHSHSDHGASASDLMLHGIDCYSNAESFDLMGLEGHRRHDLVAGSTVKIGEFDVLSFSLEHDVPNSGYLIRNTMYQESLLFITDTYYCRYKFKNPTVVMLEVNYSEEILSRNIEEGRVPKVMGDRVRRSHFELNRAIDFLKASDLTRTKVIILMHLSDGNSNAEQFKQAVETATGIRTVIAEPRVEIEF